MPAESLRAATAPTPPMPPRWRFSRWWLLPLCALVALVYWPGRGGGFVFDDISNLVNNPALHVGAGATWQQWLAAIFSSPSSDLQRPLAMLTFAINHALTGLDPYWMKLTNIGIHMLNAVLVFGLVRRLLRANDARVATDAGARNDWIALWVAGAWALNPINLMAVLFVVQRMESLSHTFVFAGLWLYLSGRMQLQATGHGWPRMLAGLLGGTALGVLVKESAALLPLYALAIEWCLLHFASDRIGSDRRLQSLFAIVLVLPAITGLAWLLPKVLGAGAYAGRAFTLGERLLTEPRVVLDYLRWTLLPNLPQLSLYHDDYPVSHGLLSPPSTALALVLLAALVAAMLWLRRRRPLMALGLAWFLSAQLLTATVIPLELMFEHRNYFASLGLMLVLGDALLLAPPQQWRRAALVAALALVALYAGLTAVRASQWRDPLTFSLVEASKRPQSPRATYDVARNFVILSDYQPDSPYTARAFDALDAAMRVPGSTPLPEAAAITLAARTHRPVPSAWWQGLQGKLQLRVPGRQETGALNTLVTCQLEGACSLPLDEMEATFAAALARRPTAEVLSIQGNYALNILDDPDRAMRLWTDAARLAPGVVQYQVTLARMLIASGRPGEARHQITLIRQMGRMGQNESMARMLEEQAKAATAPTIDRQHN